MPRPALPSVPPSRVLPSTRDKPRFVADMFGRIAPRYDLMNTLMTAGQDRRWRAAVVRTVLAHPHLCDVLDVGTGTGKLAAALARAAPGVRVVGVDFADPMLRAAPRGLRLAQADALRLPFAAEQFDAVVSAFVLRNIADLGAGLAEQVRVLRPGGRLVLLETTPGPHGWLGPVVSLYFRQVVPILGKVIAGDPIAYTYLPESTAAFLEPERLAQALRDHGLQRVRSGRLGLGTVAITSGDR